MLNALGMVAEMERVFIKARQRDGIAKVKEAAVYEGGKSRTDAEMGLRAESNKAGSE